MDQSIEMQIRAEIYHAFETLGAEKHLLGIIGSWGDTQEDGVVLELLKLWNSGQYKANWKALTPNFRKCRPGLPGASKCSSDVIQDDV
jgi:hypothetical protein